MTGSNIVGNSYPALYRFVVLFNFGNNTIDIALVWWFVVFVVARAE